MKVALANPPWRSPEGRFGVRAGSRWPHFTGAVASTTVPYYCPFPFYLAYAAAALEAEGHEVLAVDAIAEGIDDAAFVKRVTEFAPDVYVAETSTPSWHADIMSARAVHDALMGETTICLVGPHVSTMREKVLEENPFVGVVVLGEYDQSLNDILNFGRTHPPGALWRDENGTIVAGPSRPLVTDLDSVAFPARHHFPMQNYADHFCGMPHPMLQMWASRGCPFTCVFCLWPQVMYGGQKKQYRVRSAQNILDEIERDAVRYGCESVYFDDDTFDIGNERMCALADEMLRRGFSLPWGAMARADTIDVKTLTRLRDAGLYAIKYGVESSDPTILETSGKRLDLARMEETMRVTKDLGIRTHLTFTFGLPGETWDTIRHTVDYSIKLNPDSLQYSISTPFPGTAQYEWAKANGYLLTEDWTKFNGSGSAVVRTEALSADILEQSVPYAYTRWAEWKGHQVVLDRAKACRGGVA